MKYIPNILVVSLALTLSMSTSQAYDLIWNDGNGNFVGSPTWSYNDGGLLSSTDNPFILPDGIGIGGENTAYIVNNASVTLASTTNVYGVDNYIYNVQVGSFNAAADLTGIGGLDLRGDGMLTVTGSHPLWVDDLNEDTTDGKFIVGQGVGAQGTVNWNSSGALQVGSYVRIGVEGTGTFNQNDGTVSSGYLGGSSKYLSVGQDGGTGTYNLNHGHLEAGTGSHQSLGIAIPRLIRIGLGDNSTGLFNVGDGIGAAGSAVVDSWDRLDVGESGTNTTGTMIIHSDGLLRINLPIGSGDSQYRLCIGGGSATGLLQVDGGEMELIGPLEVGVGSGNGTLQITGTDSMVTARALQVGTEGKIVYDFNASGVAPINLFGAVYDDGSPDILETLTGVNLSGGNSQLILNNFNAYTSDSEVILVDSFDWNATVNSFFGNYGQGTSVGQNANGTEFYINYFGGIDNNDLVLQTTLPNSVTDGLVWNIESGNFDAGFYRSDGDFGAEANPSDPFGPIGDPGTEDLFLGNDGVATLDDTSDTINGYAVRNLRIGTHEAASRIASTNGDGTLTVRDSANLTITDFDGAGNPDQGNLYMGNGGTTGTVNWDSTGTLDVQGKLRIGQSGIGIFNQTAGLVTAGSTSGGAEFMAIGEYAGGDGTYNLKGGTLRPGDGAGRTRLIRIGYNEAMGTLNVGDGLGDPAYLNTEDDIDVGNGNNIGGVGTMNIYSDGAIYLSGDTANLVVGLYQGVGTVNQMGGTMTSEAVLLTVGGLGGGHGTYNLMAGSIILGPNGENTSFRIGANTGTGIMRVEGTGHIEAVSADLVLAYYANTVTSGRLELVGSNASVAIGRLDNPEGADNSETISWEADANGITTLVVTGTTTASNPIDFVQLQDPSEVGLNTGTNGNGDLMGNGTDLELDLSALSGDHLLTLIDNQSAEPIIGFFEDPSNPMDLYEEGEEILGTGFHGTVTISYLGGTGNDAVLDLLGSAADSADFDNDGDVDGADFLAWQAGFGINDGSANPGQGDANGDGNVNNVDLTIWQNQFGANGGINNTSGTEIPEPSTGALLFIICFACIGRIVCLYRAVS